ncbi:MAG: hypothetical protein ING77_02005 [Rhodocyclaceae bacterium]|nr:hypothetical protein [Rhodocyclaceae bacterium]MCA3075922.1 hypothetical protein [Rhodocyclaceae bacterium]MCA3088452.1 hypothetical protein [Rhodocyclaceae bacterium]MCA3094352.1 hypothetical protein [Rhodocyclaceae bacterium]MCA3096696.1 hypothetical protein [Rhodocyclaceae bacterium]
MQPGQTIVFRVSKASGCSASRSKVVRVAGRGGQPIQGRWWPAAHRREAGQPQAAAREGWQGRLKVLFASNSAKRVAALPDMATLAETYPDFEASSWFGMMVPAGPGAAYRSIRSETRCVTGSPSPAMAQANQSISDDRTASTADEGSSSNAMNASHSPARRAGPAVACTDGSMMHPSPMRPPPFAAHLLGPIFAEPSLPGESSR